jgi:hypothetical protein
MAQTTLPTLHATHVRKVYDDGNHNAFTDLCRFQGRIYLTFRSCPQGHMLFTSSQIKVLVSADEGQSWREVHAFSVPTRDVRDPHFLVFQNRLFVYTGTWLVDERDAHATDVTTMLGYCAVSSDGEIWEGPHALGNTFGYYIWRAATYNGKAYLCGRCLADGTVSGDRSENQATMQSWLLGSDDGLNFTRVGQFQTEYGDETAFLFEPDGTVVALARGGMRRNAQICYSRPPYTTWTRRDLGRPMGGPLITKWGSHYLIGGRKTVDGAPTTTLYWLSDNALHEAVTLPSGGDTSYPGFVASDDRHGLLSFYSSHEGSGTSLAPCAIYLADLRL